MALQQIVPIKFTLQGDGTSKVFKYHLSQMFSFQTTDGSDVISASTVPTSASAKSTFSGGVVATISGGELVLTFNTAPANGQQGSVAVNLFFVSQ